MSRFSSAEVFVRLSAASRPSMLGPLADQDEATLSRIVAEVADLNKNSFGDPDLGGRPHARQECAGLWVKLIAPVQ